MDFENDTIRRLKADIGVSCGDCAMVGMSFLIKFCEMLTHNAEICVVQMAWKSWILQLSEFV